MAASGGTTIPAQVHGRAWQLRTLRLRALWPRATPKRSLNPLSAPSLGILQGRQWHGQWGCRWRILRKTHLPSLPSRLTASPALLSRRPRWNARPLIFPIAAGLLIFCLSTSISPSSRKERSGLSHPFRTKAAHGASTRTMRLLSRVRLLRQRRLNSRPS